MQKRVTIVVFKAFVLPQLRELVDHEDVLVKPYCQPREKLAHKNMLSLGGKFAAADLTFY